MSEIARRDFLAALGAASVFSRFRLPHARASDEGGKTEGAAGSIRVGYAAITWGGKDDQAIEEIAGVGFKAIQLRASAFDTWGAHPDILAALLRQHGLTSAVLSR